jgi:hypothetical protein
MPIFRKDHAQKKSTSSGKADAGFPVKIMLMQREKRRRIAAAPSGSGRARVG